MSNTFVFPAPLRRVPSEGYAFSRSDLAFRVSIQHDDDPAAPWEREDGHGPVNRAPVSGWWSDGGEYYHPKRAGSLVLCYADSRVLFYDFADAMRIAKRDGWGLSALDTARLRDKLGREPTRGQICEAAVRADFERLRDWCEDRWEYVTVSVRLLDVEGRPTDEVSSLDGIESDASNYLIDVANELAEDIIARIGDTVTEIPARPASFTIRKAA